MIRHAGSDSCRCCKTQAGGEWVQAECGEGSVSACEGVRVRALHRRCACVLAAPSSMLARSGAHLRRRGRHVEA
eukprot:4939437-Pleurochrysis_carterae.AAC.2